MSITIIAVPTVPPSVTTLQPAPVVVNTTVDLVCVVTGDTPIDIVWEHVLTDGSVEEVFTGNDTTGGNFTLTVNMGDYGTYQCNASSRYGMDSSSVNIIQAGKYIIKKGGMLIVLMFCDFEQLLLSSPPLLRTLKWQRALHLFWQ